MRGPYDVAISLGVLGVILISFAVVGYFLIRNRNK